MVIDLYKLYIQVQDKEELTLKKLKAEGGDKVYYFVMEAKAQSKV